jgi:dipeptidyl aminopeptidase/acylaminoacyl peptidase
MIRKAAVALLLLCPAAFAQTWTPDTVVKVKPVAEVRVSPDGTRVVYTVSEQLMADDKSEVVRQIWMAKSDGSENAQLTFGEKSSNDPHWLPDGSGIVFTSRRSGKPQLYLLRLRGGEAEPLTSGKLEVVAFEISPDGKSIAFTASDAKEDEEKKAKAKEDYRWIDEDLGFRRLYVMAIDGERKPRKLVGGDFSVGGDGTTLDWSPDSKWIAYDGKWLAYVISDMPPRWGTGTRVQLASLATGEKKDLAATYDSQPDVAGFSADGRRVYVREARGTVDRIYAVDVASNKVVDVSTSDGALNEANLNDTATHIGLAMQSLDKPVEAYVTSVDRYAPVQVSRVNESMAKYPAAKTEVVRWKSSDGKEIEGLLTYPLGYAAGKRVPLLLIVHGGPAGVFKQAFLGNYTRFPSPSSPRTATRCCG